MSILSWVRGILTGSAMLLACSFCLANDLPRARIDLILPLDNAPLRQFAQHVQDQNRHYDVRSYIATPPEPGERGDILVTVSDDLLPIIDAADYPYKVALYVSETAFAQRQTPSVSAVYSDQPIRRQLALTAAILSQRPARLAVPYLNPRFRHAVAKALEDYPQLTARIEAVDPEHPTELINRLIQNADVLLATPEIAIYNAETVRAILLGSYRHRTMVIGPNQGFVNAGALASVVSQPIHYAAKLNRLLAHARDTGALPAASFPDEFDVAINHSVARSMGLPPLNAEQLKHAIQRTLAEESP